MPDRLPAHFGRQQERDGENGSAVGVPAEYPPAHAIARKAVDDRSVLIDRGAPLVDDRISLVDHEPAILFGGALGRVPVSFPIRWCLSGERVAADEQQG